MYKIKAKTYKERLKQQKRETLRWMDEADQKRKEIHELRKTIDEEYQKTLKQKNLNEDLRDEISRL